jgi:hypothetical protein
MSRLPPAPSPMKIAAIDLGSNSIPRVGALAHHLEEGLSLGPARLQAARA